MTNSEAIEKLETDGLSSVSDMDFITNALEENTKLKAEIEQLRNELKWTSGKRDLALAEIEQLKRLSDQQSELNIEQFKQIDNQYQEIEQLKSEFERGINEVKRNILLRRWIYTNDATPIEVLGMDWANRMNDWCVKIIEEAEQSLKGKVKE